MNDVACQRCAELTTMWGKPKVCNAHLVGARHVTLEDLDRRLDALQMIASTLTCAVRDLVQAQKNTNEAVRLLADNLRAEVNTALGIRR